MDQRTYQCRKLINLAGFVANYMTMWLNWIANTRQNGRWLIS